MEIDTIPDEFIDSVWNRMAQCPQHTFLILTKRPKRMLEAMENTIIPKYGVLPHVWLGCTVVNQAEADTKIPELLKVPGKKWVSYEPALGPVDFSRCLPIAKSDIRGPVYSPVGGPFVDLIITGGETGPGARPCHPDWIRSVRDQCAAAGVPFYFKQWGEWFPMTRDQSFRVTIQHDKEWHIWPDEGVESTVSKRVGRTKAGRTLDGQTWDQLPWRTA